MEIIKKLKTWLNTLHGTTTEQDAQSTIPSDAEEEVNKENYLIKNREQIKNTPFWVLETEQGWFLVMGAHRLSKQYKTKKEAIEHIEKHKWELIIQLGLIMTGQTNITASPVNSGPRHAAP